MLTSSVLGPLAALPLLALTVDAAAQPAQRVAPSPAESQATPGPAETSPFVDLLHDVEARWASALPRMSLIARDWGQPNLLAGHLCLTDQARTSRSNRMLIGRLRFGDADLHRVAAFGQMALGQWQIDRDLLPALPRDVETAGQVGAGIEWSPTARVTLALEADYTLLFRPRHEPQMVLSPDVADGLLAARWRF